MLKYQAVKKSLLSELSRMRLGMQLPPVRTLMSELNVSQTTVMRAIGELEADGYLDCRSKSGIFATNKRIDGRLNTVAFLVCYPLSRPSALMMRGIQSVLQASHRGIFLLSWTETEFADLEKILEENQISQVIIQPSSREIMQMDFVEFVQRLQQRQIEVVQIDVAIPGIHASFAGEANLPSFQELGRRLYDSGVRKIAAGGKFGSQVFAARLQGLQAAAETLGMQVVSVNWNGGERAIEKAKLLLSISADAYVVTDSSCTAEVVYELQLSSLPPAAIVAGVIEAGDDWPMRGRKTFWLEKNSEKIGKIAAELLTSEIDSPSSAVVNILPLQLKSATEQEK